MGASAVIPVYVPCAVCRGSCRVSVVKVLGGVTSTEMLRCWSCDGLGRQWAPGAPAYGCEIALADRVPGEIVTLGNGQRAKIQWHMPRKTKKVRPETTFLSLIAEFTDEEGQDRVPYPSCIGVLSVDLVRATIDHGAHDGERAEDLTDPVHRAAAGLLI
jgi:hypothetical protein